MLVASWHPPGLHRNSDRPWALLGSSLPCDVSSVSVWGCFSLTLFLAREPGRQVGVSSWGTRQGPRAAARKEALGRWSGVDPQGAGKGGLLVPGSQSVTAEATWLTLVFCMGPGGMAVPCMVPVTSARGHRGGAWASPCTGGLSSQHPQEGQMAGRVVVCVATGSLASEWGSQVTVLRTHSPVHLPPGAQVWAAADQGREQELCSVLGQCSDPPFILFLGRHQRLSKVIC